MLKIDSQAILGHFFNHLNSYLIPFISFGCGVFEIWGDEKKFWIKMAATILNVIAFLLGIFEILGFKICKERNLKVMILRERIISQLDEIILILRESKKSDEKSDFQNKFLIKIAEIIEIKKELEKKSQASEKKDNKGLKNGNVDKKDDIKEENKSYDNIKD